MTDPFSAANLEAANDAIFLRDMGQETVEIRVAGGTDWSEVTGVRSFDEEDFRDGDGYERGSRVEVFCSRGDVEEALGRMIQTQDQVRLTDGEATQIYAVERVRKDNGGVVIEAFAVENTSLRVGR